MDFQKIQDEVQLDGVWSFVEKYYPNYHTCDMIALCNDLQCLMDKELESIGVRKLLRDVYGGDINNPQIDIDYMTRHYRVYELAILAFIEKTKNEQNCR